MKKKRQLLDALYQFTASLPHQVLSFGDSMVAVSIPRWGLDYATCLSIDGDTLYLTGRTVDLQPLTLEFSTDDLIDLHEEVIRRFAIGAATSSIPCSRSVGSVTTPVRSKEHSAQGDATAAA